MVRKRSSARPVAIVVFVLGCLVGFAGPAAAQCPVGACFDGAICIFTPQGTYVPFPNTLCEDVFSCPPGTSTSGVGATSSAQCFPTPPGTYAPGGTPPIPCPTGTYQPLSGQSSCYLCPGGTANPNTGSV